MATRSSIAIKNIDGTIEAVYCHWDGYIEHHGPILLDNYSDETKLRSLLAEGAISSLAPEIGTKHDFESRPDRQTTFYSRDRGESDCSSTLYNDEVTWIYNDRQEYNYLYIVAEKRWVVMCGDDGFVDLSKALKRESLDLNDRNDSISTVAALEKMRKVADDLVAKMQDPEFGKNMQAVFDELAKKARKER